MGSKRKAVFLAILTLVALVPVSYYMAKPVQGTMSMTRFASYWELQHFILKNSCGQNSNGAALSSNAKSTSYSYFPSAYSASSVSTVPATPQHSGTNDQVQGVDELDTVKSDGHYIYSVDGNNLTIVQAYPPSDAKAVSRINVNGTLEGIFVDGNRIAVLTNDGYDSLYSGSTYFGIPCSSGGSTVGWSMPATRASYPRQAAPLTSSIRVYDASDHSNLLLKTTVTVNGTFVDARLIGDVVYMIADQAAYCCAPVSLPVTSVNGQAIPTAANTVYHSDIQDSLQSFTSIVGLKIIGENAKPIVGTFLIGTSSTIYVSLRNIYLASPMIAGDTAIHRVSLDTGRANYDGTGVVPGRVLNQFSMDEYQDHFRIVTTTQQNGQRAFGTSSWGQETNLYVLDSKLQLVGRLEGLGSGELFHSARFMGDRAYLVTFKKTDPLFVIDLHSPENPTLLGKLIISGYSDYLQPLDSTHILGIGKDTADEGSFAWYQGVKVSLFDVHNPVKPIEVAHFIIGDRGSDSIALRDHKSVLLDASLSLLVIPVEVAKVPSNAPPNTYGSLVWQGAYVFRLTPDELSFRGGITHLPSETSPGWVTNSHFVTRSLYIGNVLYTLSQQTIKMNNLTDLSDLGAVQLNP